MPIRRTKCLSTKLTDQEYTSLVGRAAGRRLSEWARDVLLADPAAGIDRVILAELLALRTILLNLHFAVARGEPVTGDAMERLIELADRDKVRRATEDLTTLTIRREP
jgi:hypothetical protein